MSSKTKKRLFMALFVLLNAAVILYTALSEFAGDHGDAAKLEELEVNEWFLIPAVLCFGLALLFETLKYAVMLRRIDGKRNLKLAFETAVLGKYYDNVTPFGAGGQPFQIYHLSKNGIAAGPAGAIPVLGFLGLMIAFILTAAVCFIFGGSIVSESVAIRVMAYIGICFYMATPSAILLFTFLPRVANAILGFFIRLLAKIKIIKNPENTRENVVNKVAAYDDCLKLGLAKRGLVPEILGLSVLYHLSLCSVPYFVILAFGGTTTWISAFVTTIFIYAAITFIPTPGNAGAAEVSFYAVFSMLTTGYIFWAMLSWRFLTYYMFIISGLVLYLVRFLQNKKKKQVSDGAE